MIRPDQINVSVIVARTLNARVVRASKAARLSKSEWINDAIKEKLAKIKEKGEKQ